MSFGYDVMEFDGCLPRVRFAVCPLCGGSYEPIEPGEGVRFTRPVSSGSLSDSGRSCRELSSSPF